MSVNNVQCQATLENRILVTTEELMTLCGCCGRKAALQIGTSAQARVNVGRRVFWNVAKINSYLQKAAE